MSIASLIGGSALLGLGASPAGAAPSVNVNLGNPGVISVGTGTTPGFYLEIPFEVNSEGVPLVYSPGGGVLVVTAGRPGQGVYGVIHF